MQTVTTQPSLFMRDHTLLGVCEGLGEDFGFNPVYLRVTLAAALIWNPVAVIGGYLAAGALVLVSRLLVREPRAAFASTSAEATADGKPVEQAQPLADNEDEAAMVAVAA
jgi:phage shock protein PspC (stress-responsive transcriptional regulator)